MISKEMQTIFGLIWERSSTFAMMVKQECSVIVAIMSQSGFLSFFSWSYRNWGPYLGILVHTCHDRKTRMFYDSFYYEPIGLSKFFSWSYRNWDNPPFPSLLEMEDGKVDYAASVVEGQQ